MAGVNGKWLQARVALPVATGAYRATITLTDRRFGEVVAQAGDVAVFVPGPRRATLRLHVRDETIGARGAVSVSLSVANTGTESWAEQIQSPGVPVERNPIRATRVVAYWIRLDDPTDAAPPTPVELRAVPLAPGELTTVSADLQAPDSPGAWALVVDVVDDVDGSFAARGSAPAVAVFGVVLPRGMAEVE